jgi:hypothetical protein
VIAPKIEANGDGGDDRLHADALARGRHRIGNGIGKTAALVGFARMCVHGADRAQHFAGERVGIGDAVLALP